ncbi:ATP-binding cassette domain-containing protein [Microbispora corallina]|uniref:ABC transporter ATP-binding protein n=1 Tax=Microbispora corallina TaxID=83302 RepID=A0ABQ4G9B0_9ACTN|nr:ATP-binding cassette domain-containing protein [Microbispora corallina]GIH43663.1 ABC transporter ATP-binding protein [Microbispora corallina]
MIDVTDLTKGYGGTVAVDRLTFHVKPGRVTGFLGPNGAGKSTTMRVILGLDRPTAGTALIGGRRYGEMRHPLREVGALLDATAVQGGRTPLGHLGWIARSNRIGRERVAAVLELAGLAGAARTRIGRFSLGMKQRLGIAAALLGDPGVLMLDEPVNGLDPDGVRWIRGLLRGLAAEGRTVLLSSHLMSEMELTADHLVVIGRGRLIADTSLGELAARFPRGVLVRSPRTGELARLLAEAGAAVATGAEGGLTVSGLGAAEIGELAARHAIPVHEVTPRTASLEDIYLRLTDGATEHAAGRAER